MSGSVNHGPSAEPNLTPILDMVFQLITFFMLVINFKAASLDLSLKLPIIGSARPVDTHGVDQLLILNIDSKGELHVYGVVKDIKQYVAAEAQVVRFTSRKPDGTPLTTSDELPTNVVIRADKATPFRLLNVLIKTCQDQGFRRFSLKAMNKESS